MLHEIDPWQLNIVYEPFVPRGGDRVMCYHEENLLVAQGNDVAYPKRCRVEARDEELEYLFSLGETRYFLRSLSSRKQLSGFYWQKVRDLRYRLPLHQAYAGILGHHLYRWYTTRRYCGHCGKPTLRDTRERLIYCPNCGQKEYPVIMPAVIVGVIRGDSLLMTKYANRPNPNWALVAGFAEIGETLEQTVAREVMEEAGLEVTNITYYKSQPWPFSGSLLAGFFAEAAGNDSVVIDAAELAEATFVLRQQISVTYDGRALTNEMICFFRDYGPKAALRHDPLRQAPFKPIA